MKKIGFVMQVLTWIIALPLLTILEMNHATAKATAKKASSYVTAAAGSSNNAVIGKLAS